MTKATHKRTRPLDRDGDGRDGGSLPGNATAPMAVEGRSAGGAVADPLEGADDATRGAVEGRARPVGDDHTHPEPAETAPAETETPSETAPAETETPAETAPVETETPPETAPGETDLFTGADDPSVAEIEAAALADEDEEHAEAAAADEAAEDALAYLEANTGAVSQTHFGEGDFGGGDNPDQQDDPHEPCDRCAVEHPVGVLDDGRCPACVDEEAPTAPAEADPSATFSAEEIAAGKTPVVEQEGEQVTPPEAAAPPVSAEDLVTVDGDDPTAQPVAVRLSDLRRLVDNRWLYKTALGYSPSYSAPWISPEDVAVWIKAGLAEDSPSAGREGGVIATAKARQLVTQQRAA